MESYEKLLDAWLLFIDGQEKYPIDLLKRYGVEVFNKYIQCHLSPPDGTRGQVGESRISILHISSTVTTYMGK